MPQTKTNLKSLAKIEIITLTPRIDPKILQSMCEEKKINLFASEPNDVTPIYFEHYYEPFLFLAGKYSIDYSKKQSASSEINETIKHLHIPNQTLFVKKENASKTINKRNNDEYVHVRREGFFVLDRMKHEIDTQKIPFSPFELGKNHSNKKHRKINISTREQIAFLKKKIAQPPEGPVNIIKKEFVINHRMIVYVPMCECIFENIRTHEEAATRINGITGEIELINFKKQRINQASTIHLNETLIFNNPKNELQQGHQKHAPVHADLTSFQEVSTENIPQFSIPNIPESMALGFPATIGGEILSVGDNITAIVGDLAVSSGSIVNRTLVVKGVLKIGDNCMVNGKLKAMQNVIIGQESVIDGDVISGGNIYIGIRSTVRGRIDAADSVLVIKEPTLPMQFISSSSVSGVPESSDENLNTLREEVELLKLECAEITEYLATSETIA